MGVGLAAVSSEFADRLRDLLDIPGCPGGTLALDWEQPDRCASPDRADHSQPTLLALGLSLTEELERRGVVPDAVMGHSVGEISAAAASGVFRTHELAQLVDMRRRAMTVMTCRGAMAAVLAPAEVVESLLVEGAVIGAVNSARQVVISGSVDAVDETCARLRSQGRAVQPMRSDLAFHSPLSEPVARHFTRELRGLTLAPPRLRMVSAVTAAEVTTTEALDPTFWGAQLMRRIRFSAAVDQLLSSDDGARVLVVEVGPAGSSAPMIRRHPGIRSGQHRIVSALPAHGRDPDEAEHQIGSLVDLYRSIMDV